MNWFDVVKIIGIPSRRIFLSNVVVNRTEFENTLNKLRELKEVPSRLQGVLNNEKSHKVYYDEGVEAATTEVDLSEEESKEMFDEMLQIIAEKTKEFTPREYYSIEKIRELLSEAMKAKNSDEKDKVAEIILEITENSPTRTQFWSENIPERERLEFLRDYLAETEGKAHLFFENPPSNKKILTDFAEMIGGTVKDDKIFVNFESQTDLVRLLRPKIDKNTREVLDDEETVKAKEEKLKFYNENIRPLKPKLKKGTITTAIDSRMLEARELNIRGAKYEIIGDFNERSVEKYIEIVEGLKNSKNIWKPTKFPNGDNIAQGLIFIPRTSGRTKSLVLNPYTSIILNNTFSGDSWFKTFFNALRTSEVKTDDEVEQIIIDDISLALMNDQDKTKLGLRTASFARLEKIRNLILTNAPKKRVNEAIREVISQNQGEGNLGDEITRSKLQLRREQLALLEKHFSVKEGKKIFEALSKEYDEDDLEVNYYDSRGTDITQTDSFVEKENAFYVDFTVFGDDKITPDNLEEWLTGEIKLTEAKRTNPTRGLEIALKEVKELLEKLPESESSEQVKAKLKDSYEKDIARLEEAIQQRKDSPSVPKEIENKFAELRRDLVRPTDFVSFIQSIGSKESLNELIDAKIGTAQVLEQITPKNSLLYLSKMAERLSADEVGEAFNKINDNPNSDEAKAILEELNGKIPKLLTDIKTNVVGAFKERLQFFLDNYGQKFQNRTNKVQIAPALKAFTNANMIREVQ